MATRDGLQEPGAKFQVPFSFANKRVYNGGWSREVTVRELPVSKTLAGVNMRLTAGGFRELHWHTASEWAHTPPEAVMAHLRIDKATFDAIPRNGGVVMPLS